MEVAAHDAVLAELESDPEGCVADEALRSPGTLSLTGVALHHAARVQAREPHRTADSFLRVRGTFSVIPRDAELKKVRGRFFGYGFALGFEG